MTTKTIKFGFLIGMVGGGVMALFAMTAMWATGRGFLTVVNIFAHTFWKGAPLDGTFSLAALELGLLIHLIVSTIVGTIIAYFVERGSLDAGVVILLGIGVGATVWVVQAFAWTAIDADAHAQFSAWILAVAHVVFALGAATFLTWLRAHDEAATDHKPMATDLGTALKSFDAPRPTRAGFSRSVADARRVAAPESDPL